MIELRPASSEDRDRLAAIGLAAWMRGIGTLVPAEIRTRFAEVNPFVSWLSMMGPRVIVSLDAGELAGLAASENADDYISDVWVDPAREGRGIGRHLVAALEAEIAERGYEHARLSVVSGNRRALRLYEYLGFEVTGRELRFDKTLQIEMDVMDMSKRLVEGVRNSGNA